MTIMFFSGFFATILYVMFAKLFMEKMSSLDEDIGDNAEPGKRSIILMKYVFFLKDVSKISGVNGLLWATRVFFIIGLSLYMSLVLLILFQ